MRETLCLLLLWTAPLEARRLEDRLSELVETYREREGV
jgi:hypothetical protein